METAPTSQRKQAKLVKKQGRPPWGHPSAPWRWQRRVNRDRAQQIRVVPPLAEFCTHPQHLPRGADILLVAADLQIAWQHKNFGRPTAVNFM